MRRHIPKLFFVLLAVLIVGVRYWGFHKRYAVSYDGISSNNAIVTFKARVINYPVNTPAGAKIVLKPQDKNFNYKVLAVVRNGEVYHFSDLVGFTGNLKLPVEFEDFSYKNYLASRGILAVSYTPKITILERSHSVFTNLINAKDKFNTVLRKIYPYKHSLLTSGMLLGLGGEFPDDFKEDLRRSGLLHLVVVSGGNLVFILTIFYKSLLYLEMRRRYAFVIGILALFTYSFIVGFEPPVVRALIMTLIALTSGTLERPSFSINLLFIAAFLMLFINPYLLISASFQLSIGATLGLIVFMPLFSRWLRRINVKGLFVEAGVTTMSAQLGVLPVLLTQFGGFNPKVVISNVLVSFVPALVTYLGLISGLLGLLWLPLGRMVGWFNYLVLDYFLLVVRIFS